MVSLSNANATTAAERREFVQRSALPANGNSTSKVYFLCDFFFFYKVRVRPSAVACFDFSSRDSLGICPPLTRSSSWPSQLIDRRAPLYRLVRTILSIVHATAMHRRRRRRLPLVAPNSKAADKLPTTV